MFPAWFLSRVSFAKGIARDDVLTGLRNWHLFYIPKINIKNYKIYYIIKIIIKINKIIKIT